MRRTIGVVCLFVGCLALGCGRPSASELAEAPGETRAYWEQIAPTCDGFPSKAGCGDGDMALFGGLLCASGDERGCDLVRQAQGPDGEWWRSPRRNPGNLGEHPAFSRDMAMGVFLYLVKTRDAAAASRWLGWIVSNRPCLSKGPFGGCLVWGPERFCRDETHQSCTLEPGTWSLMARIWDYLGLGKNANMKRFEGFDEDALVVDAKTADIGYPMHLAAVEVLMKMMLGTSETTRAAAARILASRQPQNLFFAFLDSGSSPALKERLYSICPAAGVRDGGDHSQWSWERDEADAAWKDSMAWDCLFLDSLLAQPPA